MAETPPGELIPVFISFEATRTFSASERAVLAAMPKEERQTYVAREITSSAREHQAAVMRILLDAEQRQEAERVRSIEAASAIAGRLSERILRTVAARPEVRRIARITSNVSDGRHSEPVEEHFVETVFAPTATSTPEWGVVKIRAPELWAQGIRGGGTLAAIIDSGCDYTHPDLTNRM